MNTLSQIRMREIMGGSKKERLVKKKKKFFFAPTKKFKMLWDLTVSVPLIYYIVVDVNK